MLFARFAISKSESRLMEYLENNGSYKSKTFTFYSFDRLIHMNISNILAATTVKELDHLQFCFF